MKVTQLKTVQKSRDEETVLQLTDILRRAEAGEIHAFTGIFFTEGDSYESIGSPSVSRLRVVGGLMQLIVDRLGEA